MLGNNRGENFDVLEDGEVVLSVRYLWPHEPADCCMCGRPTLSARAVPYYCGPVREGASEGGYSTACDRCADKWERWNDTRELLKPFPAATWRPFHGGYPAVAACAREDCNG